MSNIIEFKNVYKNYNRTPALINLSFCIAELEIIAIVGNNGSGKTTTVNVLSNIIPYNSGEVLVFNKKVTPNYVSYKNRLGLILDPPLLVNEFTPREYLRFVCKFQKVTSSVIAGRIEDLTDFFEIAADCKKSIGELSSGDRMKVALSAAIIHNPDILIFDEPFIHMDPKTLDFVVTFLKSLKGKKTIFITSHNLDLLLEICDKVLIMENGTTADLMVVNEQADLNVMKAKLIYKLSEERKNMIEFHWFR